MAKIAILHGVTMYRDLIAQFLENNNSGWEVITLNPPWQAAIGNRSFRTAEFVVLDTDLPLEVIESAVAVINTNATNNKLLFIANGLPSASLRDLIQKNPHGIVDTKTEGKQALLLAVEAILGGQPYFSSSIAALIARELVKITISQDNWRFTEEALQLLTPREKQITLCLQQGLTNQEIHRRLHISLFTVKNHVHKILEKLRVPSRSQAVCRAFCPCH